MTMSPRFYYEKVAGIQQNKAKIFPKRKKIYLGLLQAHRQKKMWEGFHDPTVCFFNKADIDAVSKYCKVLYLESS